MLDRLIRHGRIDDRPAADAAVIKTRLDKVEERVRLKNFAIW